MREDPSDQILGGCLYPILGVIAFLFVIGCIEYGDIIFKILQGYGFL